MGGTRCSGRVEIYHAGRWGTVCDDRWSLPNADVVCREVKCGTVLEAKKSAFFGEGKDQIWLDDVQCSGQELSILKCAHREFGENNCGHAEDAGVVCSGESLPSGWCWHDTNHNHNHKRDLHPDPNSKLKGAGWIYWRRNIWKHLIYADYTFHICSKL